MEYHSTSSARVHKHIRLLSAAGVDVAHSFARKGLPTSIIDLPALRIPSVKTYSALHAIARKEGIEDLGFAAALEQTFEAFEDPFRSRFEQCSNVFQALHLYRSFMPIANPTRHMQIEIGEATASVVIYAHTSDKSAVWLNYSDWGNVFNVSELIKRGAGRDFRFYSIEIMSDLPAPASFFQNFDCLLLRGRQAVRLSFQKAALFAAYPEVKNFVKVRLDDTSRGQANVPFPKLVGETLKTFIQEFDIGIEEAAEIFATSPRTLQRQLATHGTSFSEILLHVKMSTARNLLRDSSISIADVATTVGYAEQASFSRAFRDVMGVTPGVYRRNLSKQK